MKEECEGPKENEKEPMRQMHIVMDTYWGPMEFRGRPRTSR